MVSEQFRSKRRTPTGGSLKQLFISFHPPIGLANGVAFFTMDQLQGHNILRASWHNLLQLDLARTASAQRARPIYCQSLCPSFLRLADRPRRFLRTTSTKTSALGCVGTLLILLQAVLFRHFSDTCGTSVHVPSKASHF